MKLVNVTDKVFYITCQHCERENELLLSDIKDQI